VPNIVIVPIDNRPVCYQLPKQISCLDKKNEVYLPDISLLGDLTKQADIEGIFSWLENVSNVDILILSLDTIAYGGLISSRRCKDSFELIKNRVDRLCEIIKSKNAQVYAFSSIMRISNNNINEEEKEYWTQYGKRIFEYSYNLHKMEKICDANNMVSCNCAATRIPDDILDDYLKTRKRNFEINKYYLELAKQGIFKTLVFSKDDCAQYGLNVKEAEELALLSSNIKNVFVKTGADEIPLTLLSRALNEKKKIKIAPLYINSDSVNKISKYEDVSVELSVKSQIELAGAKVSDVENCDMVLLVNNFKDEQGELVMGVDVELFKGELNLPNKPYFIADIVNANGADNNFIKALFQKDSLKEFYGYSAWNTTGNTLGSALACALIYFGARIPNENIFKNIQLIRFLDDWAYQANVRKKIRENSENLKNGAIYNEMAYFEKIIFDKFNIKNCKTEYNFPWNRFFEIKVSLKNVYANLPFVDILFCILLLFTALSLASVFSPVLLLTLFLPTNKPAFFTIINFFSKPKLGVSISVITLSTLVSSK